MPEEMSRAGFSFSRSVDGRLKHTGGSSAAQMRIVPQNAPGNAPASMRMFCPVMNPTFALARNAQSAPSSAGSPNRCAGFRACASVRAASSEIPRCATARSSDDRIRVGLKRAGLDRIDRHVVADMGAGGGPKKCGEAGKLAKATSPPFSQT
jgi:hypothetical protein